MTRRSKQWYTKASRLPNSFANLSIGLSLRLCFDSKIIGQKTDGDQNFKYLWVGLGPGPSGVGRLVLVVEIAAFELAGNGASSVSTNLQKSTTEARRFLACLV